MTIPTTDSPTPALGPAPAQAFPDDAGQAGLTSAEAARRLSAHGPNELPEARGTPLWKRFARQFASPLIYVLLLALIFDVVSWIYEGGGGIPVEAIAIAAVLLLNAGLGTFQEQRSEQALRQLKALAAPSAWVLRDGTLTHLPTRELVPGDVLRLGSGERVPADGFAFDARGVSVDEALLTGESMPVEKRTGDEVFSGTLMVRGKAMLQVSRTGQHSSMGKLAGLLGTIVVEPTPLERRLDAFGRQIARWVFGIAALLAVGGLLSEGVSHLKDVVLFAAALAVAAVPEGMPAVVTLTLAFGVQRMARRQVVVRRLAAVETLGSVTVICTDKTGTLTENRMTVHALEADDPAAALRALVLANEADDRSSAGDPLDVGLLLHARAQGVDPSAVRAASPRVSSKPFDSAWKFTRVTVSTAGQQTSYVKGAPEVVVERSRLDGPSKARWQERAEELAAEGYRVLALASGEGEAETSLTFLGLVALWDPPRAEVAGAIATARGAGIRVVMITGDHPGTAQAVARKIGLPADRVLTGRALEALSPEALRDAARDTHVFARVSPEHKLRLVEALQADGEVVAMTGDGVNDAPALKRSDVGVAMGKRGSDVAREVASLVLLDDNFASIVGAVDEGRGIYANIQSFVRFTCSTNVSLVLLIAVGAVGSFVGNLRDAAGLLLVPVTALQLLWINFLGDGPPALALALDRHPDMMRRPPRAPAEPLMDRPTTRFILASGALKGLLGVALLVLLPRLGLGVIAIQTVIFLSQSVAKLISAYPSRSLFERPGSNTVLHLSVWLGVGLQLLTPVVPALRGVLHLEPLTTTGWGVALGAIALSWFVTEGIKRQAPATPPRIPEAVR